MDGFITSDDDASPTKELGLMLSVFAGVLMCKIVYETTGLVSPSLFKGYTKLNDAQRIEWNNRGFSTFHALIVAVASVYMLLVSDLFDEGSQTKLITHRTSTLSNTILGMSLGYFMSDLAMILWNYPALGGMEYLLHHGLSMFSILLSLLSGHAHVYIFMVLFTEATTPFVNLRWYLDLAGQKKSKLYTFNGVAMFLGWLVARIILFVYLFYHMFINFDQVKEIFPLGFYGMLIIPPLLMMMNVFWFWKITKGLIKILSKARHGA